MQRTDACEDMDDLPDAERLERQLKEIASAIGRLQAYTEGVEGEGLRQPMRCDAIAHALGLLAHRVAELEGIPAMQKYSGTVDRWAQALWSFTWKSTDLIDWAAVLEAVQRDIPALEADLALIEASQRRDGLLSPNGGVGAWPEQSPGSSNADRAPGQLPE